MLVYGGLVLAMISWGVIPVFQKQLLANFSPLETAFLRFFFSGLIMLAVVLAAMPHALAGALRRNLRPLLLSSVCGPVLGVLAFIYGIQTVAVGVAAVIASLQPMLTYVLALALGREKGTVARTLSILISLVGVALVVAGDHGFGETAWLGLLAVLLAPLILSVNTVFSKDLVAREAPLVVTTVNILVSLLTLVPFLGEDFMARAASMPSADWGALAVCVLPATVLGYAAWYGALRVIAPSSLALWTFVSPLVALVMGCVCLGESLTLLKIAGVALVLYGLYLANGKHPANNRKKADSFGEEP
jgi:drug/metabolite transporter (DMT)-like permease